jgi:hypothetical protein
VKPSSSPSRELTPAAGRACSSHVQNRRNERADGKRSDEHLLGAAQEVVKEDPDSDRGGHAGGNIEGQARLPVLLSLSEKDGPPRATPSSQAKKLAAEG